MFGSVGRTIRDHLRQSRECQGLFFSDQLSTESVKAACQKLQHEFRDRVYSPSVTLWVFLTQVLSEDHSCRDAVTKLNFWRLSRGLNPCSPETGSYCEARMRLPEKLVSHLVRSTGKELSAKVEEAWLWLGRVVKVVDGSTITMADTPENQSEYPQQSGQAEGVGFPIARIVAVFSLAVGVVVDMSIGPYQGKQTGENNLFRRLLGSFNSGEIALADRYYASFWDFALLAERGVDLVARVHQLRKIDFRRGIKLGVLDHRVTYLKPTQRPQWMDQATYDRLPAFLSIRQCRYQVIQRGFRTRTIVIATTLLDAEIYTLQELAHLYRRRWEAELHLRSLKTHMQMDHLRCKKPATVRKEFCIHLLAYNLVRGMMLEAALVAGVSPHQLSFKGALQSINSFLGLVIADSANAHRMFAALLWMVATHRVGDRPNRIEPRVVKRRPKQYKHLREPRHIARKRLLGRG